MAVIATPKWSCPSCTYHNWLSSLRCILCDCPKPLGLDAKPPGKARLPNQPLAPRRKKTLSSAASPHIGGPPLSPRSPGWPDSSAADVIQPRERERSRGAPPRKWHCVCRHSNWSNSTRCAVCGAVRASTQREWAEPPSGGEARTISRGESILDYACGVGAVGGSSNVCPDPPLGRDPSPVSHHPTRAKPSKNGNRSSSAENRGNQRKWKCPRCTFENWPRTLKCVMCDSPRRRVPSPPLPEAGGSRVAGGLALQLQPSSPTNPPFTSNPAPSPSPSPPTTPSLSRAPPSEVVAASPSGSVPSLDGPSSSPTTEDRENQPCAPSPGGLASDVAPGIHSTSNQVRQIRNRLSAADWLFLNACLGVSNGDETLVKPYLRQSGDRARQLSRDECLVLGERFPMGSTLVHLAIRFQKSDMLSLLLTPASSDAHKRLPSQSNPDLAASIREEVAMRLQPHKGDWPCYFFTQLTTFTLPADLLQFCSAVQKKVLDGIVDKNVEKELSVDSPIINWSSELVAEMGSQLYPLWNRTAGDCLLDSVLQATWGVMDRDNVLRGALADSLSEGASRFYERWKEAEQRQSHAQGFSLDEEQLRQDWAAVVALADQQGKSLEQLHIFALAHVLRRPVVVYGVRLVKNFRGENLGYVNFEGIYLPLLWEASFCWRSPVALAYTRGHFSALVSISSSRPSGAGAWPNRCGDCHVTYLPLVDSEGRLLPLHFLSEEEVGSEERLLNEFCECHVTRAGTLAAKQELSAQQQPTLVTHLIDDWLDRFRRMDKRREAASCLYDSDS